MKKEEKTLKKFLSVLLTMAMVMSLFTGTVLAAGTVTDVKVSKAVVVEGVDTSVKVTVTGITGTDQKAYWRLSRGKDAAIEGTGTAAVFNATVDSGVATLNATYEFDLNVANLPIASGDDFAEYTLYVHESAAAQTSQFVVITVHHQMSINGSTAVPVVNLNESTNFTGLITNGKNLYVAILLNGFPQMSTQADATGAFSFSRTFTSSGDYAFGVGTDGLNYVSYKDIDFSPAQNLKLTITAPTATRASALGVSVTVEGVTGSTALSTANTDMYVEVTKPNGDLVKLVYSADASGVYTFIESATKVFPAAVDLVAGTYSVTAVLFNKNATGASKLSDLTRADDFVQLRKVVGTFKVDDNTNNMVVTLNKGEVTSADAWSNNTGITSGAFQSVVPTIATSKQAVQLVISAPSTKAISKVVYTVTGPMTSTISRTVNASDTTNYMDKITIGNLFTKAETFDLISGGTVTVSGTVTYTDKSTETFEKTVKVNGYLATFNAKEMGVVGDIVELKTVVTDVNGTPVNNAIAFWNSSTSAPSAATFREYDTTNKVYFDTATNPLTVDYKNVNIQNGVYAKTVKLKAFSIVNMGVMDPTNTYVYAEANAVVYGPEAYTVTGVKDIVAGKGDQTLKLKMYDANGVNITPTSVYLENATGIATLKTFTPGAESSLLITPTTKTGTFNILLGTGNLAKMVSIPVNVVSPAVTVTVNGTESNVITAGKTETVLVTFLDKSAPTVYLVNSTDVANTATVTATNANGVSSISLPATFIGTKTAGTIEVQASWDGGTTKIKVATLTVKLPIMDLGGVEELEISNIVDLPITLTDANGVAIKNQVIKPSGAVLTNTTFTTDDEGKVTLTLSPNTVGKLTLEAVGYNSYSGPVAPFTVSIPVVRDVKGPVVTLEEVYTVTASSATISFNVTDGSRVTEVWVGFDKAMVRPDGSTVFTFTNLNVGVNEFDVLAYDEYGNSTEATMVIEYLKPATVLLTIGSTDATKDGAAMTGMDQAPVIVNGRTFLPVRFVLVNLLGGTIEWDANTQTITSVVNGNTIKMVIGSNTAYVNGNAVALLEAPYIEATTSRTLVPMREIMEAIGVSLDWNGATQTVTITIPQ